MDYRYQIARRYLASRKDVSLIAIITGISVVGVTVGVAALIVVLSVMNGFYDLVRDLMVAVDPHVRIVSDTERGLAEPDSVMRIALSVPHVEQASAYVEGKALLVHGGRTRANQVAVVRGIEPSAIEEIAAAPQRRMGSFNIRADGGVPGIVVSANLARDAGLLPASEVSEASTVGLLSAPGLERTLTQILGTPPIRRFQVRGLIRMQSALDENRAFIPLDEAQRLFRMGDRVTGVALRLDEVQQAEFVKNRLEEKLDAGAYEVRTWYDLQQSLYDAMRLEKWGASAILMLIIVVAAFNIVGSLTMVVIQKRRDVGVLQAMGVSRRDVRRIFMLEGALIGVVGTGLGLGLGLGLALLQKYFKLVPMAQAESFMISAYPVSIRPMDVVLIAGAALVLCTLAAVYPAVRAASIEPARAVHLDR